MEELDALSDEEPFKSALSCEQPEVTEQVTEGGGIGIAAAERQEAALHEGKPHCRRHRA